MLSAAYQKNSLGNKLALAWAISHVGGPGVLEMLKEPLETRDYEHPLTSEEIQALAQLVSAIGYLGQRSPAARAYLLSKLSPEAWAYTKNWRFEGGQRDFDMELTEHALKGLAISRDPDLTQEIKNFIAREEGRMGKLAHGVSGAAFYDWYIRKYGNEEFMKRKLNSEALLNALREFYQTDIGRGWEKWTREKKGLPPRPEPR